MSTTEQAADKKDVVSTPADAPEAAPAAGKMSDDAATKASQSGETGEGGAEAAPAADASKDSTKEPLEPADKPAEAAADKPADKPEEKTEEFKDIEMKEATEAPAAEDAAEPKPEGAETSAPPAHEAATATDKSKDKARRKSGTVPEHKGKKLNKKGSKARITNIHAQPGDQYLVKLKGYPPWPAIVCDEDMLPHNLLSTRPVTARRADGTYREDFADGGKRAHDRVFPVMYLYTNEFGWVVNTCLQELSPEKAADSINDRMRKDLQAAYELAAQGNDLDYYKEMLRTFQEEAIAREKAKQAKAAKAAADAAAKAADEDLEMTDILATETPAKKSKKRKAETDAATPARSDSVKKPKIKLTSSATKPANGVSTPKAAKEQGTQKSASAKPKAKKATEEKKAEAVPKEPEMTPEERHQRKEKEVLFFRHKLQKGLLTRDQEPKEEEMKLMSDYVAKLEAFPELEVSIIRATKINKVLKAILKLESIPKDDEFDLKARSHNLLEKWNKLLADAPAAAPTTSTPANGVNGVSGKKEKPSKPGPNGVTEEGAAKSDKTTSEAPEKAEAETSEATGEKTEKLSEENKEAKEVEASA